MWKIVMRRYNTDRMVVVVVVVVVGKEAREVVS